MKSKLVRSLILVLCAALLLAALGVAGMAEDSEAPGPQAHEHQMKRTVTGSYPATCSQPGGDIFEWTCAICGAYMGEYRSPNAAQYPATGKHNYTERVLKGEGECAGGTTVQRVCSTCGRSETDTSNEGHAWVKREVKETECLKPDYSYEECSKCGMTRNYVYQTASTAHKYGVYAEELKREATCAQTGLYEQQCNCGQKTITRYTAKLPHDMGEQVNVAPTCTGKGSVTRSCRNCSYQESTEIAALGHHEVTESKAATCASAGYTRTYCDRCGAESSRQELPALGHVTGSWVSDGASHWRQCARCNEKLDIASHNGAKANNYCTTPTVCTVCRYVMDEGHAHGNMTYGWTNDRTVYHSIECKDCGYVSGRQQHSFVFIGNSCLNSRICTVCGYELPDSAHAHHSMSSIWTAAGTDSHTNKCSLTGCSYSVTEPHTWGDWTVTKAPSTTSAGIEARRCTKCTATQTRTLPALEPEATPTSAPASTPDVQETDAPASPAETATKAPDAEATAPAGEETAVPDDAVATASPEGENDDVADDRSEQAAMPALEIYAVMNDGTPCAEAGRTCYEMGFLRGFMFVRVCMVCGHVNADVIADDRDALPPVFLEVPGVEVSSLLPGSRLIVRAANLAQGADDPVDAYYAFTVAWELNGEVLPFGDTVQISLPLLIGSTAEGETVPSVPTPAFRLVRIDVENDEVRTEMWTDVAYTYEGGHLIFEVDRMAIYLLIPD